MVGMCKAFLGSFVEAKTCRRTTVVSINDEEVGLIFLIPIKSDDGFLICNTIAFPNC